MAMHSPLWLRSMPNSWAHQKETRDLQKRPRVADKGCERLPPHLHVHDQCHMRTRQSVSSSNHFKSDSRRRGVTRQCQRAGHGSSVCCRGSACGHTVPSRPNSATHGRLDVITIIDHFAFIGLTCCSGNCATTVVDRRGGSGSTRNTLHRCLLRVGLQIHKLRNRHCGQHAQNHDHHHQLNQRKAALYLFHVVRLSFEKSCSPSELPGSQRHLDRCMTH